MRDLNTDGDIQIIRPNEKTLAIMEKILEINKMITRELAVPQFIIKKDKQREEK